MFPFVPRISEDSKFGQYRKRVQPIMMAKFVATGQTLISTVLDKRKFIASSNAKIESETKAVEVIFDWALIATHHASLKKSMSRTDWTVCQVDPSTLGISLCKIRLTERYTLIEKCENRAPIGSSGDSQESGRLGTERNFSGGGLLAECLRCVGLSSVGSVWYGYVSRDSSYQSSVTEGRECYCQ